MKKREEKERRKKGFRGEYKRRRRGRRIGEEEKAEKNRCKRQG